VEKVTRRHTYAAAERFILSREFFGMKLGLQNITEFLQSIGTPQLQYPTIHIAGTNGKGSTAAMLDAVLRAAGYRVGLFTSPHLTDFRERIKVNGEKISKRAINAFIDRHRRELTKRKLSFFELVTALGLDHFAKSDVDIAVIETGLGGRLDATNVLVPLLTITTDISRDHIEILGSSLKKIAWEKGGIVKPGVPHLLGILPSETIPVLRDICRKRKAPMYRLRKADFHADSRTTQLDYRTDTLKLNGLSPSLTGTHQMINAAVAVKAVEILRDFHHMKIPARAIREGIAHTDWPGRFQIILQEDGPTLILDVCHNLGGVTAFAESFLRRYPGQKAFVITGFVKRKQHQKMFDQLARVASSYSLVPLKTKRSTDLEELLHQIRFRGVTVRKFGSLRTAYNKLLKSCGPNDIISIIGSHYLVGEFLSLNGHR
jgi:dihydrofolate synthase/folylpolyglutamate synthase